MKKILFIWILFLFIGSNIITAEEIKNCPIKDAYFNGTDGNYYECRNGFDLEKFNWYSVNEEGEFIILPNKYQNAFTESWVENEFKIKGKEKNIKSQALGLEKFSNISITLKFLRENSFFKLYNDTFKNIIPLETAFIEFNYLNEKIIAGNFMVGKNGGNYTFEENTFFAPPNSKIIFNMDTGVQIKIKDGTDLMKFFNLMKFNKKLPTVIEGKDIIFPNGFNLIEGKITINDKGYILDRGSAIYNQNYIKVDNNNNNILIANENTNLSNYNGNWIRQTNNSLEIQSIKEGIINIRFLENHKILNVNKDILMLAEISDGDGIKIQPRTNLGLVPIINHISSKNGKTVIQNGKLKFSINENEFLMVPPISPESNNLSQDFQSVPFDIESNSLNIDTKLRINSNGQFDILSKDDESLVTWNKYNSTISAKLIDNEFEKIENELNEKDILYSTDATKGPILKKNSWPPFNIKINTELLELAQWVDINRIMIDGNEYTSKIDKNKRLLINIGEDESNFQHLVLNKLLIEYFVIEDNGKGYYLKNLDIYSEDIKRTESGWKIELKLGEKQNEYYKLYDDNGNFVNFVLFGDSENGNIVGTGMYNGNNFKLKNSAINFPKKPSENVFLYDRSLSSYLDACYFINEDYKSITFGKGSFCDGLFKSRLSSTNYLKYKICTNNLNENKIFYKYKDKFCIWKELRNTYEKICPNLNNEDITKIFKQKEEYRKISENLIFINPDEKNCVPVNYDCVSILVDDEAMSGKYAGYSYGLNSVIYMNPYIYSMRRKNKEDFYFTMLHEGYHGLQSGEKKVQGNYDFGDTSMNNYFLTNVEIDPRVSLIQLWWLEKTCSETNDKDIILNNGIINNEAEAKIALNEFYNYPYNKLKDYYVYPALKNVYGDYTSLSKKDWEGFRDEILIKRLPGIAYGKTLDEFSSNIFAYV